MKSISEIFNRAYDRILKGGYSYLYVAIDVHDTVLMKSKCRVVVNGEVCEVSLPNAGTECFFPKAKEVLQQMSKCDTIRIILYTSSSSEEISKYLGIFKRSNIRIHAVNSNPDVVSEVQYADFSSKFFFDILLDDKAGFDPKTDWEELGKWMSSRLPHAIVPIEDI